MFQFCHVWHKSLQCHLCYYFSIPLNLLISQFILIYLKLLCNENIPIVTLKLYIGALFAKKRVKRAI